MLDDKNFVDLLCGICSKLLVQPKQLPKCGHVFCHQCLSKAKLTTRKDEINLSSFTTYDGNLVQLMCPTKRNWVTQGYARDQEKNLCSCYERHTIGTVDIKQIQCPTCKVMNDLPKKSLDELPICNGLEKMAERCRAIIMATSSSSNSCSHVIADGILDAVVEKIKCSHCGEEFCKHCALFHSEALKTKIIDIHSTFEQRTAQLLESTEAKKASLEKTIDSQVESIKAATAQQMEDAILALDCNRNKLIRQTEKKAAEISLNIHATFVSALISDTAELSERVNRVAELSPINVKLNEVAGMYNAVIQRDKELSRLEQIDKTVKKICFQPNSHVVGDFGNLQIEGGLSDDTTSSSVFTDDDVTSTD